MSRLQATREAASAEVLGEAGVDGTGADHVGHELARGEVEHPVEEIQLLDGLNDGENVGREHDVEVAEIDDALPVAVRNARHGRLLQDLASVGGGPVLVVVELLLDVDLDPVRDVGHTEEIGQLVDTEHGGEDILDGAHVGARSRAAGLQTLVQTRKVLDLHVVEDDLARVSLLPAAVQGGVEVGGEVAEELLADVIRVVVQDLSSDGAGVVGDDDAGLGTE